MAENPLTTLSTKSTWPASVTNRLAFASGIELSDADLDDLSQGLDVPRRLVEQLADDEQRNLLIVHRAEGVAPNASTTPDLRSYGKARAGPSHRVEGPWVLGGEPS